LVAIFNASYITVPASLCCSLQALHTRVGHGKVVPWYPVAAGGQRLLHGNAKRT